MLTRCGALAVCLLFVLTSMSNAQTLRPTDALLDKMGLRETIEIMREEGLRYGFELAEDMLEDGAGDSWSKTVEAIYDPERMEASVREGVARVWIAENGDLAAVEPFFTSDAGQEIVHLEISARAAMTEPGVEDAAREAYRRISAGNTPEPRLLEINRFIDTNDLIDANVVGTMNASYAFYEGMVDGGAFEMSEDEILRTVWDTEADTRQDTSEWLAALMVMAYRPLPEETLRDYVDLAASAQGRILNRALFAGFDDMHVNISYALGLALAGQMTDREL